jgi:hypothetical protein
MTDPDLRPSPYWLLGAIAANVELADESLQTRPQAFDRIRELLAKSNYFESIRPADINDSGATKVATAPTTLSAPAADPAPDGPHSSPCESNR